MCIRDSAPAGLVFSTGYAANLAALTALTDADTLVVSDAHVHASLVDAARLSRATVAVARHNDVAHVIEVLDASPLPRAMVVVESVYSVLGDAAPLAALAEVCRARGAVLVVDEAHAIGVNGVGGRGLAAELGLTCEPDVVVTLTLSKSLASQGGAVLASTEVREHLVNSARSFIYDTGLAPAAAGAALAALDVLRATPALAAKVRHNSDLLAAACAVDPVAGAVLSVVMPGPDEALAAVAEAARHGIRIGCFRPPSTPDGSSRIRLTAHSDHADLGPALDVLREIVGG